MSYVRRAKRKTTARAKIVPDIIHNHKISIDSKSDIYTILKKDKLEDFINIFGNTFDIQNNENSKKIQFDCNISNDCKDMAAMECILYYNQGLIAKHVIRKNKINMYDILALIKMLNKNQTSHIQKYNIIKRLFLDCMLYLDLSDNEMSIIVTKLIKLKDWNLVDLMHFHGYRSNDINNLINYIPEHKIESFCNFGYVFTHDSLLKIMQNINDVRLLKKLGITKDLINAKNNKKEIATVYKNSSVEIIKYLEEKLKFICDDTCFNEAIKGLNFPVIFHLLNKKFQLEQKHLLALLNLQSTSNTQKKKIRYRGRRRYFQSRHGSAVSMGIFSKKMCKIKEYDNNMIQLLNDYLQPKQKKIIEKIINRAMPLLLDNHCFDLYNYLQMNYHFTCKLKKYDVDRLIDNIIRKDDVTVLKKLFDTKIILPIDISRNSNLMNMALRNGSNNMIKYFHDELFMVCNSGIDSAFRYGTGHKKLIENLAKIGYPINQNIISALCKKGAFDVVKYLMEKGCDIPSNAILYAIIYKKYDMVDYFIEHKCPFNKKNMIDRIVITHSSMYRYRQNENEITTSLLTYLVKMGCTGTSKSSNLLATRGMFNLVLYLYNKFAIKPTSESIMRYFNNLSRWYNRKLNRTDIKAIIYICNVMEVNFFEGLHSSNIIKLISLIDKNCAIMSLVRILIDKLNFKLTTKHLNESFSFYRNNDKGLKMIQFYEEFNVFPNKETLILLLRYGNDILIKYIMNKYNLSITIKDLHNMINAGGLGIRRLNNVCKIINITLTPYSIKLIVDKFLAKYNAKYIKNLIAITGKITQNVHDMIKNRGETKIRNILTNIQYEIVDYPVPDDEIPDIQPIRMHSDSESGNEEDYLDRVLGDVGVEHEIIDDHIIEKIDLDHLSSDNENIIEIECLQ